MYKILLLTDFSAASRHAIAFTQALFADTAASFSLLHALPLEPDLSHNGAFLLAEQRESAEQALHDLQQSLTQPAVPSYHTYQKLVALGGPVGVVEQLLADEPFDLVVAGATGAGFSEFIGNVATGLVRHAATNVLVVPLSAPIRPVEQVVLATDYRSVNDAESLRFLTDLAARKAAALTLLTIENPAEPDSHSSEVNRRYVEKALENLSTLRYTIHDDEVRHGIYAYLDAHAVDLLVMLPHHKTMLDVLLTNSVTRSMAYHPRVPLLTLYDTVTVSTADVTQPAVSVQPSSLDSLSVATYL